MIRLNFRLMNWWYKIYTEWTLTKHSSNAGEKKRAPMWTNTHIQCAVILSLKEHCSAAITSFKKWLKSAASLWILLLVNALGAAHIVTIKIGIVPNFIMPGTFIQFNIEISSLNLITHCALLRLNFWTLYFYQEIISRKVEPNKQNRTHIDRRKRERKEERWEGEWERER